VTWRGTTRLLLLLVLLASTVWLLGPRGERRDPAAPPLLTTPEQVGRIELAEPAGRLVALRSAGGWRDPEGRPWHSDAPDDLLRALGTLRPAALEADSDRPLEEWGFGPTATRLHVLDATGQDLLVLEIGRRNPAWTARYARRAGTREVLLVGAALEWELDKLRASAPPPNADP
jgi:hypothetical protein